MEVILFLIAILGYVLNSSKRNRMYSYYLWIISNAGWASIAFESNHDIMAYMFLIYNLFCIVNIIKEFKKRKNKYD